MTSNTRRLFLLHLAASGSAALAMTPVAPAASAGRVDDNDPLARTLGYVGDNAKVDKARYPAFTPAQRCGVCALYQGRAGESQGPCPIFAGKQVASAGWCSSFVRKA